MTEPTPEPTTRRELNAARRRDRHWALVALGACIVTILGLLFLFVRPDARDDAGAAASRGPGGGGCAAPASVRVVTSPDIEPVVEKVAREVEADACAAFDVTANTPDAALASFASPGKRPHLWIPDSSVHLMRAQSQFPSLQLTGGTAFATSPLLAAVPRAQVRGDAVSWQEVFAAPDRVHLADPMKNSAGLLTLISTGTAPSQTPTSPATTGPIAVALDQVAHGRPPAVSALPAAGTRADGTYVVSEQQLFRFVADTPETDLVALPLSEGAIPLDYRPVPVPTTDQAVVSAVSALSSALHDQAAQQQVRAAGFRSPGDPEGPQLPTRQGSASVPRRLMPMPGASAIRSAIVQWRSATTGMRLLTIIDTSGSMKAPAGDSTRIELAARSAIGGAMTLPPNTDVGLWEFSAAPGKKGSWRELQPVAPLVDPAGRPGHRDELVAAAQTLPARVGGSTPLYDTILAAVQRMHEGYDTSRINAVIVMTDGRNDVPGGIDFDALKTSLALQNVPGHEVALTAIAIGPDPDRRALEALCAATDGNYFAAEDPADMERIVTAALMSFAPTSPETDPLP